MYATEKYVRQEAKELQSQINALASDLQGDIKDLYEMLVSMNQTVKMLQSEIENLKEQNNDT
jgi:FtsZ-binding cell division protein ZapB